MRSYCDCWKSQYKSMSFVQLLSVKLPLTLDRRERLEHAEYILQELRIKAPREYVLDHPQPAARDPSAPPQYHWYDPRNSMVRA